MASAKMVKALLQKKISIKKWQRRIIHMQNKLINTGQNSIMDNFIETDDILKDMRQIIESSQRAAHQAVNMTLVQRNWMMGYRIASEELHGEKRAEYGAKIIKKLSKELSTEYGKGFTKTNIYNFYSFYKTYPEIFHSASGKSQPILSWTHYRILLQVKDEKAREWYEKEALQQAWSVRTLQRNVSSQYYYRMLQTQKMDMYIRMYEELKRSEGDNPTIGIVLCSDTDEDIAKYSILHGNEQLFASKYKLYLPTEEELRAEIENQKTMFYLQQQENDEQFY